MDPLRAVVRYWRDCVKAESALEQSFSIDSHKFTLHQRSNANLFTGERDPFIFATSKLEYFVEKGKLYDKILRANMKGQEVYFGYPVLMFFDRVTKQNHIAPLFTIRLSVDSHNNGLLLTRGDPVPTMGNCAFTKLGLSPEEIASLNNEVSEIFDGNKTSKLEVILYILKKHTKLTFVEGIDPNKLSLASTIHPYDGTVVYNKAIISIGDASAYNLHLLSDLEKLATKKNLSDSSLRYITMQSATKTGDLVPILPFQFDEYQLLAIRRILNNGHTVLTGPPGTGKSQFIANLIINLFLQKKRVLFVSHTGEAVRVVNERINAEFANLIMQTGKKEVRQDLGRRLEEMVGQYNERQASTPAGSSYNDIRHNWDEICRETAYVRRSNAILGQIERTLKAQSALRQKSGFLSSIGLNLIHLQLQQLTRRLGKRRASHQVLRSIESLKERHVILCRAYVKANYLELILESGLYGDLAAYIDAVQNKKSTSAYRQDTSDKYIHAALRAMSIWSCTLKSLAASFPLRANIFDYVIFDEASQVDLPSAAPALYRAQRSVVVGDENQLNHIAKINPKVEEELAKTHRLSVHAFYPSLIRYTDTSLFSSAKKALNEPELELKNHYRSNILIANLFSSVFYGGRLRVYEPAAKLPSDMKAGVYWLDVKGTAYKHKAGSRYNSREATYVVKLLEKLLPIAQEHDLSIGVATPYTKQQTSITDKLVATFDADALTSVRVLTVHKFQGSEVDILIFSPVVAQKGDDSSDYWYVKNEQILNVAISRAKHLLLIAGDREFALCSDSKLKDIAQYCRLVEQGEDNSVPKRPMNIYEKKLFELLKRTIPRSYQLEPQYVIGNRFTLDFALMSKRKNIAVELDGRQHEIIGGLPVFEDKQRDAYLTREGWMVVRITVYELLGKPDSVIKAIQQSIQ